MFILMYGPMWYLQLGECNFYFGIHADVSSNLKTTSNICRVLQKEPTDDCVFAESVVSNSYNTYASVKYSNTNVTNYVGMNENGVSRRIHTRSSSGIGKLSDSALVLPEDVPVERLKSLEQRENHASMRHNHICPPLSHVKNITKKASCKKTRRRQNKSKMKAGSHSTNHEGSADENLKSASSSSARHHLKRIVGDKCSQQRHGSKKCHKKNRHPNVGDGADDRESTEDASFDELAT